jgi:hypothetical protein
MGEMGVIAVRLELVFGAEEGEIEGSELQVNNGNTKGRKLGSENLGEGCEEGCSRRFRRVECGGEGRDYVGG